VGGGGLPVFETKRGRTAGLLSFERNKRVANSRVRRGSSLLHRRRSGVALYKPLQKEEGMVLISFSNLKTPRERKKGKANNIRAQGRGGERFRKRNPLFDFVN